MKRIVYRLLRISGKAVKMLGLFLIWRFLGPQMALELVGGVASLRRQPPQKGV